MQKNTKWVILVQVVLWAVAVLTIAWLWDRWMLRGAERPYRWIGMDFAPYWVGVRQMLHGINPYSADTTSKIQQIVYGGPALWQDPMMFIYPAWLFIPIIPLSLLPYDWAAIIYVGTLFWAMLNLLHGIASNLGGNNLRTQALWLILLIIGSLPFLIISVTKGQLGYFCLLAVFFAYRYRDQKPVLAGILLGLALIKPTVTVIPVAGFVIWALLQKDWKFLAGFIGCEITLLLSSLLAIGNWIPDYLHILSINGGMPTSWSIEILATPWNMLYTGLFIFIGVSAYYWSLKKKRDYWFPAIILLGIALTPMHWIYDLFLGILIIIDARNLSIRQSILVGIAILSPWALVLVPSGSFANFAVVGLPLVWAVVLFALILPEIYVERRAKSLAT